MTGGDCSLVSYTLSFPQNEPHRVLMKYLCSSKCIFQAPWPIPTRHVSTCDFTLQLQWLPQKLQQLKLNCFLLRSCHGIASVELLIRSNRTGVFLSLIFLSYKQKIKYCSDKPAPNPLRFFHMHMTKYIMSLLFVLHTGLLCRYRNNYKLSILK